MSDEFLVRSEFTGLPRISKLDIPKNKQITEQMCYSMDIDCYQKAQPMATDGLPIGVVATEALLKSVGYLVKAINDGCCGRAGVFGYEK